MSMAGHRVEVVEVSDLFTEEPRFSVTYCLPTIEFPAMSAD